MRFITKPCDPKRDPAHVFTQITHLITHQKKKSGNDDEPTYLGVSNG